MRGEIVLSREELMVYLNQQKGDVLLDYPLTDQQIASLSAEDKKYSVELHDVDIFDGSESTLWRQEMPHPNDYMQCFLAAGLTQYSNIQEFRETVQSYSHIPSVVYVPDTNLYYNRFLSTSGLEPDQYLVVDSVHKEINHMLNRKYNPREINEIKQQVRYHRGLLDEFLNRRKKQSRIAYNLALAEYQYYKDHCYAIAKTDELSRDKEANDMVFVKAVAEYKQTSGVYPIVITCDQLLTDLCDSHNIPSFLLKYPKQINPSFCTPGQLLDLISCLAGVLGLIKANKTIIYGEYRGKTSPEMYKLKYLNNKTPHSLE
ncbi:hypothetical protein GF326_04730, partial [Candidatus Bathyarchaeota archaeon]|nr:hypothetical protein [Candidatus Bathyarchaeota archaeon]